MEEGNQLPTRLCTVGVATASAAPIAKRQASYCSLCGSER